MQEKFVIFKKLKNRTDLEIGILIKENDSKVLILQDNIPVEHIPFDFTVEYMAGRRVIKGEIVDNWINDRVPPPYRQDINDILKELELREYNQWELFKRYLGRSVRDTYFITQIS